MFACSLHAALVLAQWTTGQTTTIQAGPSDPAAVAQRSSPAVVPDYQIPRPSAAYPARPSTEFANPAPSAPPQSLPLGSSTPPTSVPAGAATNRDLSVAGPQATRQANPQSAIRATELLQRALRTPDGEAIAGQPVSLRSLLVRVGSVQQQRAVIGWYWRLARRVAEHQFASDEYQFLASLAGPANQPRVLAAVKAAEAGVLDAQREITAAQYQLASSALWPSTERLPLPQDQPLVSPYQTEFQQLAQTGLVPNSYRWFDELLPRLQRAVELRAESVDAARSAVSSPNAARQDAGDLLQSFAQWQQHRREFLVAVESYNAYIADYAIRVAQRHGWGASELVGMLVASEHRRLKSEFANRRYVQPIAAVLPESPSSYPFAFGYVADSTEASRSSSATTSNGAEAFVDVTRR